MAADPMTAQTHTHVRTVLRVVGVVLLIAGLVIFVWCGRNLLHAMTQDSVEDSAPIGSMLGTIGGFLMIGVGLQALNVGFLRAQATYVAQETSGAVRTVSREVATGIRDADGPFCSGCGGRNLSGARFCSACGRPLAGG